MSDCNCSSCNPCHNFSTRSNTAVTSSDKDLSNFLASEDYAAYTANFSAGIIKGEERLLTFNNTTLQALWLPTIMSDGEKQVLFTYYKLGTTDYLTFVVNSRGDFTNLLDMSGTWNLWFPDKTSILTATFAKSAWTSETVSSTGVTPEQRSIVDCIIQTVNSLGLGSAIACAFDPEACLLAIAIDCAWEHLIA
ncbi:MAG: hypothetical protein LC117_09680 [Bacteroidia bacterium]|nr:hypothetical protein [Bacteroidia bacterium]